MNRYCYNCGNVLSIKIPEFDTYPREVCVDCGWIHYENPKVQVTVVVRHCGKILWMRRAEDPRRGYWSLPGGFMENNESPREAAARETFEETGLSTDPQAMTLYVVGNLRSINEVHLLFHVESASNIITPGREALDVRWFDECEAPWQDLAYPIVEQGLRRFYRDIRDNEFGLYYAEHSEGNLYLKDQHRTRDSINMLTEPCQYRNGTRR